MKRITVLTSAVLLALLLLAGCAGGASAPSGVPTPTVLRPSGTPDPLTLLQQRSLHLPALAPGEACVAAPGKQVSPDLGPALGKGPIYLVGYGTHGIISIFNGNEDGGWYYLKTLWAAPPDFHGLFLLRGRQIDGAGEVRFSRDVTANPAPQAEFSSEQAGGTLSGWLPWINYVRVRALGCYGVQVDGLSFSEVIRFQVVNTPQQ
jgi:hypothetical protein